LRQGLRPLSGTVAQTGTVSSVDEEKRFPINRCALGRAKLCHRLTQGS
jgi:hypothetical protein